MENFKVVIFGSRGFNDYNLLETKCDEYLKEKKETHNVVIVSGNAKGADMLGEIYAKKKGFDLEIYPANWTKYGVKGGFIRNEKMANMANAAIGFWDGQSHGTQHMIELCKNKNINTKVINYNA